MRAILAFDSFKGSLSAAEACSVVEGVFVARGISVVSVPVADGGEGTVAALVRGSGGVVRRDSVRGPYGVPTTAERGLLPDGTAVVELAQAAGLVLAGGDLRVAEASTYGVGEQILAAAREGARRIVVGLGGSATNDGGCGAAAACGVVFRDAAGEAFVPVGASLRRVESIDVSGLDPAVAGSEIVAMCDVDNPLTGPHGA
ncbi:MAG: glycerate kinase, partial [bacterium]|nr:glycerate kinase [bacterium]